MKSEFQRILREKIQERTLEREASSPSSLDATDPSHLAFLLGTIEKSRYQSYQNKTYFAHPRELSDSVTLPLPTLPSAPPHLSLRQKEGWLWFWKRGAALSDQFTKTELQKQYRRLARLLHPDQNRHPKAAESFMQLREHYENLLGR